MEYVKCYVYEEFYKILINNYLKRNRCGKLKYLSCDTTFIMNKLGTEDIKYNGHYYNKPGIKISLIVDTYSTSYKISSRK